MAESRVAAQPGQERHQQAVHVIRTDLGIVQGGLGRLPGQIGRGLLWRRQAALVNARELDDLLFMHPKPCRQLSIRASCCRRIAANTTDAHLGHTCLLPSPPARVLSLVICHRHMRVVGR